MRLSKKLKEEEKKLQEQVEHIENTCHWLSQSIDKINDQISKCTDENSIQLQKLLARGAQLENKYNFELKEYAKIKRKITTFETKCLMAEAARLIKKNKKQL